MKRMIVSTTKVEAAYDASNLGDVVRGFAQEDRENPHLSRRYLTILNVSGKTIVRGYAEDVEQSTEFKEHENDRILNWDAYFNDVTLTVEEIK